MVPNNDMIRMLTEKEKVYQETFLYTKLEFVGIFLICIVFFLTYNR